MEKTNSQEKTARKACVNHREFADSCNDCRAADDGVPSYVCPKCRRISYNPHDIALMFCGACKVTSDELRLELVTELDLTNIAPPNWPRRCDCWTAAILALLQSNSPEAVLVHAWVRNGWSHRAGQPAYVHHAWVEMPAKGIYEDGSEAPITVCVDFTQLHESARFMPRDDYYRNGGVCDIPRPKRYTVPEAIRLALKHKIDGPWPEDEPAADERPEWWVSIQH